MLSVLTSRSGGVTFVITFPNINENYFCLFCCRLGSKACENNRSMTLIDSLRDEGTNLPTQLYRDPPPSLLTIVGSAVATIVFDAYVIKWLDMREEEGQT
jgi:hypothetical protein